MSAQSTEYPDVATLSDLELLRTLHDADSDAFAVLYQRHARAIYAFAADILHLQTDVEEVVQDTFVLAWKKLDPDRVVGQSVLPWLLSTAKFLSYNTNRKRMRLRLLERGHHDNDHPSIGADDSLIHEERNETIAAAVAALSPTDRSIVLLCLAQGLTYKEAARELSMTSDAIRNRLSRARKRLRTDLLALRGEQT